MSGWTYNANVIRKRDKGRFVSANGSCRRKTSRTGRSGSGEVAMLSHEALAERLVDLEDECDFYRRRCRQEFSKPARTRDCRELHDAMLKTCSALCDLVSEMLQADPRCSKISKSLLSKLLEDRHGVDLTPRTLGRWPYAEAIDSGLMPEISSVSPRQTRIRKHQRTLPRRLLIFEIEKKRAERDQLEAALTQIAREFAKQLQVLSA